MPPDAPREAAFQPSTPSLIEALKPGRSVRRVSSKVAAAHSAFQRFGSVRWHLYVEVSKMPP